MVERKSFEDKIPESSGDQPDELRQEVATLLQSVLGLHEKYAPNVDLMRSRAPCQILRIMRIPDNQSIGFVQEGNMGPGIITYDDFLKFFPDRELSEAFEAARVIKGQEEPEPGSPTDPFLTHQRDALQEWLSFLRRVEMRKERASLAVSEQQDKEKSN